MSGRTLYIDDPDNGDTPVWGCGCGWEGAASDVDLCTDGVLTPGDHCPVGRCPECDAMVYLDRPLDRAENALRHLIRLYERGEIGGRAEALTALEDALAEATGASARLSLQPK